MSGSISFADREELGAWQRSRLTDAIERVRQRSSFYRHKLTDRGASAAELATRVEELPFTTKEELVRDQGEHAPYGSNLCDPLTSCVRAHQTSSTSGGTPLVRLDTADSWSAVLDAWEGVLEAAEVGAGDRVFFAFSFGPFLGFWAGYDAAWRRGCLVFPGGALDSQGRLAALFRHRVQVLCCTPTYAIRLGEVAREERAELEVRTLIVAGEPGGAVNGVQSHLESLWPGARICDHYGLTEVGPVTVPCRAFPRRVHVLEPYYLAEVIDPETDRPVALDGSTLGELVLSNLQPTTSPLLRYRTRDLVRPLVQERCSCGSPWLALEGGVLGRADDMVVVRGVNLYPSAVEEVVRRAGGVAEYRVLVRKERGMSALQLEFEAHPGEPDEAVAARLQRALRHAFQLAVGVRAVRPGTLPRFELKARRWIRES